MRLQESRLFDPHHARHYGSVLICGWLLAGGVTVVRVAYPDWLGDADFLIGSALLAAHLYSLRVLLGARRITPNMMAALATLAYIPAALLCLIFMRWEEALFVSAAGGMMALLSGGLFLPGLAPLLAYFVTARFIRPHEGTGRALFGVICLTAGWVVSGLAAWIISHI